VCGQVLVVAELVAEDDQRGVQRRADLVDRAEHERHQGVHVDLGCGVCHGTGVSAHGRAS